jgi:thiamine biosynthesis lipoprotein
MTGVAATHVQPDPARAAWVEQIMGMPISIHLVRTEDGPPPAEDGRGAIAAVFDELRWVDATFSTYRPDSDVSRLARGELAPADCHPAVAEVLDLCEEARDRTGGAFDHRIPAPSGVRLDPSGLVKGWAAERAGRFLAQLPELSWCLNAGGDLTVGSTSTQPHRWRIGLEDPLDPERLLAVVELVDGAVATSGRTHRGDHIVDPTTRRPATGAIAATVIGPGLMWADVLATAAVVRDAEALGWIGAMADHDLVLVDGDGRAHTTIDLGPDALIARPST